MRSHPPPGAVLAVAMLAAAGLSLTACSSDDLPEMDATTPAKDAATQHSGTLAPPESATDAVSYNPAAPPGAEVTAEVVPARDSTTVELTANGLQPDRGYAVHAHTNHCGTTGEAAGPHFQNRVDPAATPDKPSVDPAYANPNNEIWLDLRTDSQGSATARTTVPFTFTDRTPASLVVHDKPTTATSPGQAGTAGGRLACFTLRLP
ncbi:superoxide dismutase [Kibdelosporangium aridum]|uniref:Superoxide dismutase n=1 Tax=Kibdelosporangium aridum TaxID=2030 RepID=A0A428Z463_KIBAR|nr:superoxide dismutase family protein [Kibdelosporangium aridum]RSM80974.1 superoxide dismutase [Kibdelosporangium aridum]